MNEQYLFNVRPDRRQLEWQHMEMYAFLHYGMNTMTDREWGAGARGSGSVQSYWFRTGSVDGSTG